MKKQILICDDDQNFQLALKHALKSQYECKTARNGDEALIILKNTNIDLILLDVQMRTKDEGLKFIPLLREADQNVPIIVLSGLKDYETVKEAFKRGALDFISKDFDPEELLLTIKRTLSRQDVENKLIQKNCESITSHKKHQLVGESVSIKELRKTIQRMQQSPANILITGETGTGKEVVARNLRKTLPDGTLEPFVAIDSATIQSTMAESILFGHEKGAFTGAEKSTQGIFEEANGGLVYFDELANMPLEIQAKLLRVLQEKEVTRIGSNKVIPLNFRVVAATNKDLDAMVKEGRFKEDLLQRIAVLPIQLPKLSSRVEDIPLLTRHFISKHAPHGSNYRFTEGAMSVLQAYEWPGNVRELGNMITYILAMSDTQEIDIADLPPKLRDKASAMGTPITRSAIIEHTPIEQATVGEKENEEPSKAFAPPVTQAVSDLGAFANDRSFYERVALFEKAILERDYLKYSNNLSKMALELGMDRSHLYSKLKQYGIHAGRKSQTL